jgi:polyferredoxin
MVKIDKPKGLIRYASENTIASGEPLHYTTRMKIYTGLCLLVLAILSVILFTRKDVDATIMRTPGQLFQERGTDSISNLYNIKVVNKTVDPIELSIRLKDGRGKIEIIGKQYIPIEKEGQGSGSFFVVLPNTHIKNRKTELELELYEGEKKVGSMKTNFLGPVQ